MPTLSNMHIPHPKSWDEFEDITLSSFKIKWSSPNLQRNGRQGQRQHGVDIYGEDHLGQDVGIQCKLTQSEVDEKIIEQEIANAEHFTPIKVLYFATTSPRDAKIQTYIRLKSKERIEQNKFALGILFWDDLMFELAMNREEFARHYPDINIHGKKAISGARLTSIIILSYHGIQMQYYMNLYFDQAFDDPKQYMSMCTVLSASATALFNATDAGLIRNDCNELEALVRSWIVKSEVNEEEYRLSSVIAAQIEARISSLQTHFSGMELAMFLLGIILGGWSQNYLDGSKKLSKNMRSRIEKLFEIIAVSEDDLRRVSIILDNFELDKAGNVFTMDVLYSLAKEIASERDVRSGI